LKNGTFQLHSLFDYPELKGVAALYWMDGKSNVVLPCDSVGNTQKSWIPGKSYNLRARRSEHVDYDIGFSDNMDIFQVDSDFHIVDDSIPLSLEISEYISPPDYLIEILQVFAQYNTMRLEASRRFVVSLFIHLAIKQVPPGKKALCIDEETQLSVTMEVVRDGEVKVARYHGPIDMVIAHSEKDGGIPKDAAVLIFEIKKADTFAASLPQATAQASSALLIRKATNRGVLGSGGPIHFVRTDGNKWIFSKVHSSGGGNLIVQHSKSMSLWDQQDVLQLEMVPVVFSWLIKVIEKSRDSSPRTSITNLVDDYLESLISAQLSSIIISNSD
jgi:hypothetical protein